MLRAHNGALASARPRRLQSQRIARATGRASATAEYRRPIGRCNRADKRALEFMACMGFELIESGVDSLRRGSIAVDRWRVPLTIDARMLARYGVTLYIPKHDRLGVGHEARTPLALARDTYRFSRAWYHVHYAQTKHETARRLLEQRKLMDCPALHWRARERAMHAGDALALELNWICEALRSAGVVDSRANREAKTVRQKSLWKRLESLAKVLLPAIADAKAHPRSQKLRRKARYLQAEARALQRLMGIIKPTVPLRTETTFAERDSLLPSKPVKTDNAFAPEERKETPRTESERWERIALYEAQAELERYIAWLRARSAIQAQYK
jgi:hypothetical protein